MLKLAILNPRQYGIKVSDLLRASVVGLRLGVATVVKQEPYQLTILFTKLVANMATPLFIEVWLN